MSDWTKDRHAAARKACEAATSGPWCIWDGPAYVGGGHDLCIGAPNEVWITNVESDERSSSGMKIAGMSMDPSEVTRQQRANAEFLATARTDLPAALDEIERLNNENEGLRALLQSMTASGRHDKTCEYVTQGLRCSCGFSGLYEQAKRAVGGG